MPRIRTNVLAYQFKAYGTGTRVGLTDALSYANATLANTENPSFLRNHSGMRLSLRVIRTSDSFLPAILGVVAVLRLATIAGLIDIE